MEFAIGTGIVVRGECGWRLLVRLGRGLEIGSGWVVAGERRVSMVRMGRIRGRWLGLGRGGRHIGGAGATREAGASSGALYVWVCEVSKGVINLQEFGRSRRRRREGYVVGGEGYDAGGGMGGRRDYNKSNRLTNVDREYGSRWFCRCLSVARCQSSSSSSERPSEALCGVLLTFVGRIE